MLYDEGFQPAPQASRSSLADTQKQDGSDADEQIDASDNEDAASFRTATGNSEEAAALGNQVASLLSSASCCFTAKLLAYTSGTQQK